MRRCQRTQICLHAFTPVSLGFKIITRPYQSASIKKLGQQRTITEPCTDGTKFPQSSHSILMTKITPPLTRFDETSMSKAKQVPSKGGSWLSQQGRTRRLAQDRCQVQNANAAAYEGKVSLTQSKVLEQGDFNYRGGPLRSNCF